MKSDILQLDILQLFEKSDFWLLKNILHNFQDNFTTYDSLTCAALRSLVSIFMICIILLI
jgi:hypothetical protein